MPDPDGKLIKGSRVRVRISIGADRNITLVPDTSILTDQDKKYVLVLDDKNVVQRVDINTAHLLDDGARVVIAPEPPARGLTVNDRIIVQGLQAARINYPVDPVKPTTQTAQPATQPTAAVSDDK